MSGTDLCNDGKRWKQGILQREKCICGTVLQKNTIETTGAGDTFMACILNTVLDKGINGLSEMICMRCSGLQMQPLQSSQHVRVL